jgi:hypothetical protein
MQKVHVKNFFRENSQKIDKNFDVSFSSTFLFYRVFRRFLAMGVQKHYKKRLTKKSCRKLFTKKSTRKSQTDFFSIFFYHVFGRFSVRGVQKHDKKISKKNLTSPGTFLASEEPTNNQPRRGPSLFFLSAPWHGTGGRGVGPSVYCIPPQPRPLLGPRLRQRHLGHRARTRTPAGAMRPIPLQARAI